MEGDFLQRDIRIFPPTWDVSATTGCTSPIPLGGLVGLGKGWTDDKRGNITG